MKLINWFQIPATDIDRAMKFYGDVLGAQFHRLDAPNAKHAFFAMDTLETVRGRGVTIHLNCPKGVDEALPRVVKAGGKIIFPKTSIVENGWIALIQDTEGNANGSTS